MLAGLCWPAAAIALSARRLDAALKGQRHPECRDAGCCCSTVPLDHWILLDLCVRCTEESGLFPIRWMKIWDLCLDLEGCSIIILVPHFSNQFVICSRFKLVCFLQHILTKTHSHHPLKIKFFTFREQISSLLWRKVPQKF